MKTGRRTFIKSIFAATGGLLLLGFKGKSIEKNKTLVTKKEERKCTSIYCRYNTNGNCSNQTINNE